jgi:predicted methyltransferase
MKDELTLIESQILKIFRNNKKKAEDNMEFKELLDDSLKVLADNFDAIIHTLEVKGYVNRHNTQITLTDKGDEYLYRTKLYSDY